MQKLPDYRPLSPYLQQSNHNQADDVDPCEPPAKFDTLRNYDPGRDDDEGSDVDLIRQGPF